MANLQATIEELYDAPAEQSGEEYYTAFDEFKLSLNEGRIRAAAVSRGIPCITTLQAADAAILAMEALRQEEITVQAVQDRFPVKG